jgi:hypothetical protein
MNDDYDYLVGLVAFGFVILVTIAFVFGDTNGESKGRNQAIIYCIEQPAKCKVEYDYLKLTKK